MTKEQYRQIIREGVEILTNDTGKNHTQKAITQKLKYLGLIISEAYLSKVSKKTKVWSNKLKMTAEGILKILFHEEGLVYNEDTSSFEKTKDPDWKEYIVPVEDTREKPEEKENDIQYHEEGRWSPTEKVGFMKAARHEVIEVGVRLRAFLEYMTEAADKNFKRPIEELLERGITVKCFLLDPDAQLVHMYFNDLANVNPKDRQSEAVIRRVITGLKKLSQEFADHPGTLEVYTYANIPQAHYFAVDKDYPSGKMMVSHYIYGIPRGKCPVVEFTRKGSKKLFEKYDESLELLMQNAKKIAP